MGKTEEIFHKIAGEVPGAKESKMFGALCIKAPNGKAAVMVWKDNLVFKLEGAAMQAAISLDGAGIFEPMEGRPMGGWVRVPVAYSDKWGSFAHKSMEIVRKLKK